MLIILEEPVGEITKKCRDVVPMKELPRRLKQMCSKATKEKQNKQTHRHRQQNGGYQRGRELEGVMKRAKGSNMW